MKSEFGKATMDLVNFTVHEAAIFRANSGYYSSDIFWLATRFRAKVSVTLPERSRELSCDEARRNACDPYAIRHQLVRHPDHHVIQSCFGASINAD